MAKILELEDKWVEDPVLRKLFEDIIFLRSKLIESGKKIVQHHKNFKEEILSFANKKVPTKLGNIEKGSKKEIRMDENFYGVEADHELFYELDTFMIDLKRLVEFSLRFLSGCLGIDPRRRFSLESVLSQLSNEEGQTKSMFVISLEKSSPECTKKILEMKEWLNSINSKRMEAIHYSVKKKVEGFKITYFWNSIKSLDDKPEIIFEDLVFLRKPIPKFVKYDLEKIDEFIDPILIHCESKFKQKTV